MTEASEAAVRLRWPGGAPVHDAHGPDTELEKSQTARGPGPREIRDRPIISTCSPDAGTASVNSMRRSLGEAAVGSSLTVVSVSRARRVSALATTSKPAALKIGSTAAI